MYVFICLFIYVFIYLFIYSLTHLYIHIIIYPFTHSFIHLFILMCHLVLRIDALHGLFVLKEDVVLVTILSSTIWCDSFPSIYSFWVQYQCKIFYQVLKVSSVYGLCTGNMCMWKVSDWLMDWSSSNSSLQAISQTGYINFYDLNYSWEVD